MGGVAQGPYTLAGPRVVGYAGAVVTPLAGTRT